ncbi:DUF4142 domain-containing protein [Polluticoccus soli]|uniref:DUF4142 domain-containing protein n=1 Tax=Polluticoccus soli TaxID=3034150 RepID=UPI0023E1647F|nr:DUF4142 domain-containing protein [Flavipsychrobacter sp. JY13-12]
MKLKLNLLSTFAIAILAIPCAGQDKIVLPAASGGPDFEAPSSETETEFVKDALEDNLKEMSWLNAGMEKGTSSELKTQAAQMLDDHKKMDSDLRNYASKKGILLTDIDGTGNVNFLNVKRKKGPSWDKEWTTEMISKHRKEIKRFEDAQGFVTDNDLKNLVADTLPVLRSHLETLIKLKAALGEG